MKNLRAVLCASTIALAPSLSHAGGFDLTGQPIDIIFEKGNYIEGGIGFVTGDVEGEATNLRTGNNASTGNIADDLRFITLGAKADVTDNISAAILYDTPFFRETTYSGDVYTGTSAQVEANTVTLVGKYTFADRFSVYAGPRVQNAGIDLQGPDVVPGLSSYDVDVTDYDFGFVAGAAFEIPELRVRASLTYNSAITHDFDATEALFDGNPASPTFRQVLVRDTNFEVETPQSVNLTLQAPVTTSTLVKADIRWTEWGGVNFTPPFFQLAQGRPVVEYTEDVFTYRLTVAQRINENFVGFITGSYEEDGGEEISLFKTVDGGYSLGGGVIFESDAGVRVQLAGEYRWLEGTSGAQADPASFGFGDTDFDEANAFALSLKFGYRF